MEQRIPPHSDEAEKSVLGAMLLSKDALFDAQEVVKREDFYNEAHREIFDGISALYRRNEPVDVLTVTEELSKRKTLEMAGGRAYVERYKVSSSRFCPDRSVSTSKLPLKSVNYHFKFGS